MMVAYPVCIYSFLNFFCRIMVGTVATAPAAYIYHSDVAIA